MFLRIFFYILLLHVKRSWSAAETDACDSGWLHSASSQQCFRFHLVSLNWTTARDYCVNNGGDLASFNSQLEEDVILQEMESKPYLKSTDWWIGLNHRAKYGFYEWSNNDAVSFLNFDSNLDASSSRNMNKRCFLLRENYWKLADCDEFFHFPICKKPANAQPDATSPPPPLTLNPNHFIYGCKEGWKYFEERCYQVEDNLYTRTEARHACTNRTGPDGVGRLVTLSNEATSIMAGLLARKSASGESKLWLNLDAVSMSSNSFKRVFYWPTMDPMLFSRWDKFEPKDESCVVFDMNHFYWSTTSCESKYRSICQHDAIIIRTPTEGTPAPGCPGEDWISSRGNCYYVNVTGQSTYAANSYSKKMAEEYCSKMDSSLLVVRNIDEQYFIQDLLGARSIRNAHIWLGMEYENTAWKDQDQQPVQYFYWALKQKENDKENCAVITTFHDYFGQWLYTNCNSTGVTGYICKKRNLYGYSTPTPVTPTVDNRPCKLGSNWFKAGDKCYSLFGSFTNRKNWVDASIDCITQGGQLASIADQETNSLLADMIGWPGSDKIWIGLNAINTQNEEFSWADDSVANYFNWLGGSPSNHLGRQNCAEFLYHNGSWTTETCAAKRPWMCSANPGEIPPTNIPTRAPSTLPPGESCGSGNYKPINHDINYCYRMEESFTVSWQTARELCLRDGGDLFSVLNQDDTNFLLGEITQFNMSNLWIGLNQLGIYEGYKWSDGNPVSYTNWGLGQPDNEVSEFCVIFSRDNGFWFDRHCDNRYSYFCKRPRRGFIPQTPSPPPILPGGCPLGFTAVGNKCYKVFSEMMNYRLASAHCHQLESVYIRNPVLATVKNSLENSALVVLTSRLRNQLVWLGARKVTSNGAFLWTDNSRFIFANWNHGQPMGGEDMCVSFVMTESSEYQVGKWRSRPCTEQSPFICMTYKSPNFPSPSPEPEGPCPTGYHYYGDGCFDYRDSIVRWIEASELCHTDKATLTSINDIFEQSMVHSLIKRPASGLVWIGMSRKQNSSSFLWEDNRYVTYTKWGSSQPSMQSNKLCVAMQMNGTWATADCQQKLPFICSAKFGAPPTTEFIATGYCPSSDWLEHGNFCYLIELGNSFDKQKRFSDAEFLCTQMKGHLVSFRDRSEHKALLNDIEDITKGETKSQDALLWTGMFKLQDETFAYKDESPVDFFYWSNGEPNNAKGDCVAMDMGTGGMTIRSCSDSYGYICKIQKTAASTTTASFTERPQTYLPEKSSSAPPGANDFFSQLFNSKRANGVIAIFILLAFLVLIACCLLLAYIMKRRAGKSNIFPLFGGSVNTNNNGATSFDNVYFDRNLDQVAMEEVDLKSPTTTKSTN